MGVKSTVFLSYREAENFYYEYELEEELERLNDLLHGGEGFENYIIRGEGD